MGHAGLVVYMVTRLVIVPTKIRVERKLTAMRTTIQAVVDADSLESATIVAKSDIISVSVATIKQKIKKQN